MNRHTSPFIYVCHKIIMNKSYNWKIFINNPNITPKKAMLLSNIYREERNKSIYSKQAANSITRYMLVNINATANR